MPWKECHVVDERVRFMARLLDGEKMTVLCQEFGISRKTGYKIYDRYKQVGVQGLSDRSRRPYRQANQLPMAIEKSIVRLKKDYPSWGAPKIRERLKQRWPEVACPAISTVHAVLDRQRPRESETAPGAPAPAGDDALLARCAQCVVVCGLQRRIHARQSALLLPADDHGFRDTLPDRV